jgi:hypothetical protein
VPYASLKKSEDIPKHMKGINRFYPSSSWQWWEHDSQRTCLSRSSLRRAEFSRLRTTPPASISFAEFVEPAEMMIRENVPGIFLFNESPSIIKSHECLNFKSQF